MVFLACALSSARVPLHAQDTADGATSRATRLAPTVHPPVPASPSQYWLVPDDPKTRAAVSRSDSPESRFGRGVRLIDERQLEAGQALIDTNALAATPLGDYALYYRAVALMGLTRYSDAETLLHALEARRPQGFVREAMVLRLADLASARGDATRAVDILEQLADEKLSSPESVWLQLARAAERAGDREKALKAYRRVYYQFALSNEAAEAQSGIERLQSADLNPPDRLAMELARAQKLFDARRWAQARAAYEPLSRVVQGEDADVVALRLAECDYYLDRFRVARDELRPHLKGHSREAEARFFYLTATRGAGDEAGYVQLARAFVTDYPDSSWTEEVLNNLASHYVVADDDDAADAVFRDLLQRFPRSKYAERAAWKVGWRAYRGGNFAEAAQVFEDAAVAAPRADYRPSWLYWAGRAHDRLGETAQAAARYRIVVADYENSYYGRLASKQLASRDDAGTIQNVSVATAATPGFAPIPTDATIRNLIALDLYDVALREIQYAQRVWGDSAQLQATIAFIRHNQSLELQGFDRLNALRGAITAMKRAYPQFIAAGGEDLPPDVLRIIFPLDYWNLITKYSTANGLDPYIVAALMAQESTFAAEVRSVANAYGLMQLLPSTASRYARRMGIKRLPVSSLIQPDTNVKIGTEYFKDLVDRFGGAHYALASYNAGENRVVQWMAQKPGIPQDEFIDDIPFPETQNYVKRILGTAEDYRRLYGGGFLDPNESLHVSGQAMKPLRVSSVPRSKSPTKKTVSGKRQSSAKAKPAIKQVKKRPTGKPARRRSGGV